MGAEYNQAKQTIGKGSFIMYSRKRRLVPLIMFIKLVQFNYFHKFSMSMLLIRFGLALPDCNPSHYNESKLFARCFGIAVFT